MVEIGSVVFYIKKFKDCMEIYIIWLLPLNNLVFYCDLKLWFLSWGMM